MQHFWNEPYGLLLHSFGFNDNKFISDLSLCLPRQLLNVGSSLCLDTPGRASEKKASVLLHDCHKTNAMVGVDPVNSGMGEQK